MERIKRLIIDIPNKARILITKEFSFSRILQRMYDAYEMEGGKFIYRSEDFKNYMVWDDESLEEVLEMVDKNEVLLHTYSERLPPPPPAKKTRVEESPGNS